MVNNILLIIYSFGLSFFLGVIFQIRKEHLLYAGLAGAITRIALIFFTSITDYRFVYMFLSAMCCALYAELMAMKLKVPSIYLLCPSMLPLIPGDLITMAMTAFFSTDSYSLSKNLYELFLALMGMAIGFVCVNMVLYYRNRYFLRKLKESKIAKTTAQVIHPLKHLQK